jgi:glycosyltransferase involved in cell wall biosynthesis
LKILLISYWFAPASISNAKRPYYLARTLLDAGHSVEVLASFAGMESSHGELVEQEKLFIRRLEDPLDWISRFLKGRWRELAGRIFMALGWPDEYVLWALRALRYVQTDAFDRILVFVRPESLFLLPLFKGASKKWRVDCQESFLPERVKLRRSPVQHLLLPLFMRIQRQAFAQVGKVAFTSERSRQEYIRQGWIDSAKSEYLPLFFDDTVFFGRRDLFPSDKFIILYPGRFGRIWGRSPESFFRALSLFLSRRPEARSAVEFHFYGPWYSEHSPLIGKYGLVDVVYLHPSVPYEEYRSLIASATLLLLVVAREDDCFIPAKMMDYFATGRPILTFAPQGAEVRDILFEAGHGEGVVEESEVDVATNILDLLWRRWQEGADKDCGGVVSRWRWSALSSRLLEFVGHDREDCSCL